MTRRNPKSAIQNLPSADPAVRKRYVWRIARFEERFEMDKDGYHRRGGLDFVRMYITAATKYQSNESSQFMAQLEELDHYYPEQSDAYEGRFWRLMRLTATQEDYLRGYLLDEHRHPLSDARIAARRHLDLRVMKATLAALKRVGLMEYVECPDFTKPPMRATPPEERVDRDVQTAGKARRRPVRNTRKQGVKCAIRVDSGVFGNTPESLCEVTNDNSNLNSMANGQRQLQANPKGVVQGQTATSPTTTPPEGPEARASKPQEVTAEGPRHPTAQQQGKPATAPPGVLSGPKILPIHPGDASRIGELLPRVMAPSCTLYADDYAREIFALLRAPFAEDTRDGQRELGNYRAAWLDAIDAGLSSSAMDELLAKTRKDAQTIGSHRKRYYAKGSPEQYWRFQFNRHMHARVPPARAGPSDVRTA